ncbi:MAG: DUF3387 domain-containing protein, partial [Planctomycetota bacterium]|nr:DUF3387 domain-containing protein [Planctomycetota bacterium]
KCRESTLSATTGREWRKPLPYPLAQPLSRPFRAWDVLTIEPRALPWAGLSRPFGAVRAISTMQEIEELIKLTNYLDAATKRGEDLGLTDDEVAFYDAQFAESAKLEQAIKANLRELGNSG